MLQETQLGPPLKRQLLGDKLSGGHQLISAVEYLLCEPGQSAEAQCSKGASEQHTSFVGTTTEARRRTKTCPSAQPLPS